MATIPALVENVLNRPRRTCLRNGTLFVETVEHCMAALAGMGVDNAVVKVSGGSVGELPGGDGSSRPFVEAIQEAGRRRAGRRGQPLIIRKPIQVALDGATIAALPGPTDRLEVMYEFEAPPPVGRQTVSFHLKSGPATGAHGLADDFASQIAPARTFVFENEARELRARGLGKHLTPKELLVIAPDGPIENAFRFADECARHKMLDLIGDLFLVGRPIRGRIVACKSGHKLNHIMARRLLGAGRSPPRGSRWSIATRRWTFAGSSGSSRTATRCCWWTGCWRSSGDYKATGIKNVTFNDIFFQGHYPGTPIMPGVLIVEAMAQLGGLLLSTKLEHTGKLAILLSMDKVKMRHPVVPGDQLILEATAVRVKSRTGHVRCKAFVEDKLACEADIKFMLVDAEPDAEPV